MHVLSRPEFVLWRPVQPDYLLDRLIPLKKIYQYFGGRALHIDILAFAKFIGEVMYVRPLIGEIDELLVCEKCEMNGHLQDLCPVIFTI